MSFTNHRFIYNSDAPSIASLMATSGVKSNEGFSLVGQPPVEDKQEAPKGPEPNGTELPAAAATPVETTTLPQNAEKATPETPTPQPTETPAQPQKEEPVKVPTWQEVLKSQQPDAILKEALGFDDESVKLVNAFKENAQMKAFLQHWMNNGDPADYLRELTTDYTKMPAEDVLRQQLRQEYPKATEKQLAALFKSEVLSRYKLDPDMYSPEEVEESIELLNARADKYREQLIANQQKYLMPKAPEPKSDKVEDQQSQIAQAVEMYKSQVLQDPSVKNILTNKFISVGEGEEKVNIPLADPEKSVALLYDSGEWSRAMQTPDGKPDFAKQALVASFVADPQSFLKEYGKFYLALGGKKAIEPLENASGTKPAEPSKSETTSSNPAAEMAKAGKVR